MSAAQPFEALPVLHIDGQPLSQSCAILKYLADQYGKYWNYQGFLSDGVQDTVERHLSRRHKFSLPLYR